MIHRGEQIFQEQGNYFFLQKYKPLKLNINRKSNSVWIFFLKSFLESQKREYIQRRGGGGRPPPWKTGGDVSPGKLRAPEETPSSRLILFFRMD